MNLLTLKFVLDQMDVPKPFAITVIAANQQTGVAGQRIVLEEAILAKHQPSKAAKIASKVYNNSKKKRNIKNDANATRLLFDKRGKRLITIHIRLITHFNGIPVRYGS
ncbi:hypothetical protein SAMN05421780_1133 [Flexibacter flexilis DSM 6793]|uniref:Uncharacterized protein n=1 Tax=Flexibacter flexilis DSM 6793 TaxID=927664 RepID=A0A1I1N5Z1_9BACT|nr:hypothetical protein [Flexibacter flexilis]SFC93039.1 hypothetical protein SAMN05421780_1133 [Flexibacter flexilis DSM 6793]